MNNIINHSSRIVLLTMCEIIVLYVSMMKEQTIHCVRNEILFIAVAAHYECINTHCAKSKGKFSTRLIEMIAKYSANNSINSDQSTSLTRHTIADIAALNWIL